MVESKPTPAAKPVVAPEAVKPPVVEAPPVVVTPAAVAPTPPAPTAVEPKPVIAAVATPPKPPVAAPMRPANLNPPRNMNVRNLNPPRNLNQPPRPNPAAPAPTPAPADQPEAAAPMTPAARVTPPAPPISPVRPMGGPTPAGRPGGAPQNLTSGRPPAPGSGPNRPGTPGAPAGDGQRSGGRVPHRPTPHAPAQGLRPNPPASLRGPSSAGAGPGRPGEARRPDGPAPASTGPKKAALSPEQLRQLHERAQATGGLLDKKETTKIINAAAAPAAPPPLVTAPGTVAPPAGGESESEEDDRKGGAKRPGQVPGRDQRRVGREQRAGDRKANQSTRVGAGGQITVDEGEYRHIKRHRGQPKKIKGTVERKGKLIIDPPITVRSLSEVIGKKAGWLLLKLRDLGAPTSTTINSVLDIDLAEALAIEADVELEIRRTKTAEQDVIEKAGRADVEEHLKARPPIVTIMGHVDHGKTSLLDKIRGSRVVDTEAGGITQQIRAWSVDRQGRQITFLDTPGHEAFTKMRARGAQVTDIAVIVVAADDGVMPQTEEAIAHAKASGVSIVVAINKVDLPNANIDKTKRQLYGLELIPDDMGGDVPFVLTSAATGRGIDELLDVLLLVADIKELKANPDKLASGTCLEADLRGNEGVFATILVQQGTLRTGDNLLCGATYGRVRRMYSDLGVVIDEAGPGTPVRITGLEDVPEASDSFHAVAELSVAREIAEKRAAKHRQESAAPLQAKSLESLTLNKVTELKVIVKADKSGSIEAIRKELEKLKHEEAIVRVLHTGVGGITEDDVFLALTSPEDTMIVGFNAVPDEKARALAESRGIVVRDYQIIYQLTADVKAALEGKLKPREEVVHLGRAVVREVFKISKVGTVAGCYVTQGTIERSGKVRLIRGGLVIYPPAEKTTGLDSLKRFKEDSKEVREGFECGLKVAGYDDIKVDDVIECYRIEQVARKL